MSSQLDQDEYMFSRGHQDSTRLVLQHWLWLHRLRYILHPSIPIYAPNLKIADVGTGNAIWIMELLPHLPPTARVDGFDISTSHYPAKEWLPSKVVLDFLDAFGDIPDLLGRYDVVHIRTFAVIVRNDDPTRLLKNLIKMLRPGGWLQWNEMDLTTFLPGIIEPSASKAAADELMTKWRSECAKSGIVYNWIPNLESTIRSSTLSNVDATTFPPINEQRKALTDNALMGLEDACIMFSARDETIELGTRSQWRELFEGAVMESKKGMSITADLIVVIGQRSN